MNMKRGTAFLMLCGLAALTPACGGAAADWCDQACDCNRCSDKEYDECIVELEAFEDAASAYDCDAELADFEDCALNNNDCINDNLVPEASCGDEGADLDRCIDRGSRLR